MIGLRQTIERGTRHRWLGPLIVILLCVMLALMFMHAMHDADHSAAGVGEFCLGLTVMFSLLIVIRLRWRVLVASASPRLGRAPPAVVRSFLHSVRLFALPAPPPLRL